LKKIKIYFWSAFWSGLFFPKEKYREKPKVCKAVKSVSKVDMSFRSSLSQRTELSGIFYSNSTAQLQSNTETNLSLIASLQYVINFTNYYIYKTYLPINNPTFQGIMNGENITLSSTLSTPTIDGVCNFTGSPTINNQKIEYDLLGEIKMCINELPLNFLLCDGSSYATVDYPDLFNIIGYTYGGSNDNFNVPNFESYIPIGANSTSVNGNPTSNFVYGNGQSGATNTETISYSNGTSLITEIPTHDHSITDPSHSHGISISKNVNVYPSVDPVEPIYNPIVQEGTSLPGTSIAYASTDMTFESTGTNIQSIDPVSNLSGVNVSPPYVSMKFCICFSET
jgi:microcystin-dependent protein